MRRKPIAYEGSHTSLHVFLDEVGPGLRLKHYIVGGVAMLGHQEQKAADQIAAWRETKGYGKKKGKDWSDADLLEFAEVLKQSRVYPLGSWCSIDPKIKAQLSMLRETLPDARERAGYERDEASVPTDVGRIQAHLTLPPVFNVLSQVAAFLNRVESVFITLEQDPFSLEEQRIVRRQLERLTGTYAYEQIYRDSRPRDVPASRWRKFQSRRKQALAWKEPPRVSWVDRHPLLKAADGYCTLLHRSLLEVPEAVKALEELKMHYRNLDPIRGARFLCEDAGHIVDRALAEAIRLQQGQ